MRPLDTCFQKNVTGELVRQAAAFGPKLLARARLEGQRRVTASVELNCGAPGSRARLKQGMEAGRAYISAGAFSGSGTWGPATRTAGGSGCFHAVSL